MEGQDDYLLESSNQVDASELSTSEPSRTLDDNIIKHEDISPESLQSKSRMENLSKILDVVEISSDDELEIIDVSKGQSEAPERKNEQNQHSSGRTSPQDVTCSVCLGEYDNKAFLDKCFHAFCYFCILQWSEVVRTCPLCKSSFSSIIHSVKSMNNYQQHYLTKPDLHAPVQQSQNDGRRFRYRTTLTERHRQQTQSRQWEVNASDAWGRRAQRRQAQLSAQRSSGVISRERRRTIYSSNLWVQSVTQEGHPRQREISPQFFLAYPACTHRLIPWLTRDLKVLLNDEESHVNFVLQIILSLITKVELSSEEFCHHLRPFLFDKTEHFIHEFISFARSPFDVNAYDERAHYSWPDESREQVRDTPTVFHSNTTGWQTPLPGPSGVSLQELSQTDWNGDSSMPQNEITSWSPSSSPDTTALHAPRLLGTVTISSSSSQSVSIEHSESDEHANGSSFFKDKRKRRGPKNETIAKEETTEESRKKQSRQHDRHSRKHKHNNKRKHKHSSKDQSRRHCNSLETDSVNMPGPSGRVSVDSSFSDNRDEIIVVSDSSVSVELSGARCKAAHIDLVRKRTMSRSRSRSKSKDKRKYKHRSRSRSSDREKKNFNVKHRSRSPLCSRRDHQSTLKRQKKWKSHDHDGPSLSRGLTAERRKSSTRLGSRSKNSESRSHETFHSKRERRFQSDNHDPSNSGSVFSKTSDLLKEKDKRGQRKSRSRSHSPGLLHSRSKGKSCSKTRSKNFEKRKYNTRWSSPSTTQREGTSARLLLPGSMSDSSNRHSRSPSPNHTATSPASRRCKSRHRSRSKSPRYKGSVGSSVSEPRESGSCSNADIKREIEDLELRITVDKKRLLQLLIKQERKKEDSGTATNEETESAPCAETDLPLGS